VSIQVRQQSAGFAFSWRNCHARENIIVDTVYFPHWVQCTPDPRGAGVFMSRRGASGGVLRYNRQDRDVQTISSEYASFWCLTMQM